MVYPSCDMGSHDVETMKKLLLTVVIILGLHSPTVSAEPLDVQPAGMKTEDVAEIRNIILGQLDAFRGDDAEKAFSFAAPQIQKIFKTPEIFLRMVRKSYPVDTGPQSFEFRGTQRIDGNIVQPLAVIGPTGVSETALYIMEEQPDGTWKIGGCIMAQEPGKKHLNAVRKPSSVKSSETRNAVYQVIADNGMHFAGAQLYYLDSGRRRVTDHPMIDATTGWTVRPTRCGGSKTLHY